MIENEHLDRIILNIEEQITRLKFNHDALKIARNNRDNPAFANQANSIINQILKKNSNGGM